MTLVRTQTEPETQPESDNRKGIAALILTHNRSAVLQGCIRRVESQSTPPQAIFVVDNGSTDGTAEIVESQFPRVHVLRMKQNLGSAGGFHEGMKWVFEKDYDWIWVLDDDALPAPGALDALTRSPEFQHPKTGALLCVVENEGGQLDHARQARLFDVRSLKLLRSAEQLDLSRPSSPFNAGNFNGLLVSRQAVAAVGAPRADLFMCMDDTEYGFRLASSGFSQYVISAARVIQPEGHGFERIKWRFLPAYTRVSKEAAWLSYYMARNRVVILRQYCAWWVLWRELVKQLGALLLFEDERRARVRLFLWGCLDALRGRMGNRLPPGTPFDELCKY
jgi:rhamnopyranosyl-N-acetylglucosaminyl-diphospho-decaprenol beta-1,3/1,4-galactofuranosyltransferase